MEGRRFSLEERGLEPSATVLKEFDAKISALIDGDPTS
jgi:hypothetical protein